MIPSKLKTFAAVAAAAFAVHAETVKENWTVTYDEKLTDDVVVNGTLTLDGASLDLNGHSLKVAGLTGDGVVTDSANEYYSLLKDNTRGFYIGLDYLASGTSVDGYNHGLEYIDTGYEHNVNTVVDMKVQILKTTTDWYCYYGARKNNPTDALGGWINRSNHYKGVTADAVTSIPYPKNVPYLVHMEFGGTCTFGNESDTSTYLTYISGTGASPGINDFLFAMNNNGSRSHGANARIYYCTVKEKTAEPGVYDVKRDFVAAKRLSDGVLGMIDKANGVFYANIGSGAFIAGDYVVNEEAAAFGSSGVLRIAVPSGTTLALDDMPMIVGDVKILKEGAGALVYNEATSSQKYFLGGYEDHSAPLTAVWTGAANNNDFNDAANWSCTNDLGNALSGVAPDATTIKYILAADADWTAKGTIVLATGVALDLAGHNLAVSNITGDGVVVDTTDSFNSVFKDESGNFYFQLEYLWSNTTYGGNSYNWGSAYIDTGYEHNEKTVVDIKAAITATTSNWYCYYGSRKDWGATQIGGWIHSLSRFHYIYRSENGKEMDLTGSNGTPKLQYTVDVPFIAHFEVVGPCTIDGTQTTMANGGSSGTTDWLFGVNHQGLGIGASYMAKAKIYYCTVKEKTGEEGVYDVKRDFVAVKRLSDGELGMFDRRNGVFYVNNGSGTFIAGPVKKSANAATSALTITVAEDEALALADMASICGNIKVVKAGAGALAIPKDGVYFTGGIEVQAGTLSLAGPVTSLEGANLGAVAVASGAKASISAADGLKYGETFTLDGGTLELLCSGTEKPVTTYITNSLALNAGAKIRFDTSSLTSTGFILSTAGFTLGEGVESALSCVEFSAPTATIAEASGESGIRVTVVTEPVTAVWTGAANDNDLSNPGNWSCTNVVGGAVADAVPGVHTVKLVLGVDADWSAAGTFDLAEGVVLDLNGHSLNVANLTGGGVVINTAADSVDSNVIVASDGAIYQKILYVQATQTGASNKSTDALNKIQYVDTEYCHTGKTKVDIRVEFQDVSYGDNYGYSTFYGCRDLAKAPAYQLGGWLHGGKFYYYDTAEHNGSAAYTGRIYDIHLDKGGASYANYADGVRASDLGAGNGQGPNTYGTDYIFANNQVSNGGKYWPCRCRVYSCKVSEGDDAMREFVPVLCIFGAKAGEVGFWCNVTKKFYGNSGFGNLIAGPLVQDETSGVELHLTVADGATLSLASMPKICGNVKVVKAGAGALVAPATGQYFTGGIDVQGGTLQMQGVMDYAAGLTIPVAAGCVVSVPESFSSACTNSFAFAGGRLKVGDAAADIAGALSICGTGITVGGEFKPVDGKCVTATLLDGSTLDVSGVAGAWNAYGAVVEGAGSGGALSFADDATIKVKIGARVASARAPVVTFVDAGGEVAPPANYDTLKFVRGDAGRQYSVTKKADGIYAASGLALIIL